MTQEQREHLAMLAGKLSEGDETVVLRGLWLVMVLLGQDDRDRTKAYKHAEDLIGSLITRLHAAQVRLIKAGLDPWE